MLHHPNIIAYYDSFEEDGTLMIEMEYADGGCVCSFFCLSAVPSYQFYKLFRFYLAQVVRSILYKFQYSTNKITSED